MTLSEIPHNNGINGSWGSHSLPLPTRIAFIGNHLPRQCGIATFTTDLCAAIAAEYGSGRLFTIAVNDPESSYQYPEQVRIELAQEDYAFYARAAEFLNFNGNDLVCVQHEYGIFGGVAGSHILALLRKLKMPVVTTLHTVLREPDINQRAVLDEIARLSDRLIVMSEHAVNLLRDVYGVPREKIDLIPHGVPDLTFMDPNYFKDLFGAEGKPVLLTFGLLSPNKGIENVIRALPAILAKHPSLVYIVSGATHPHIRRREGERYREELQALALELGVAAHVIFNNRFVNSEELIDQIGAADLYITPSIARKPRLSPARSRSRSVRERRLFRHLIGMRKSSLPRGAASSFHSTTLVRSQMPRSGCWITMPSGTRCGSAPTCIRAARRGKRRRRLTWPASSARASSECCGHGPPRKTSSQQQRQIACRRWTRPTCRT